MGHTNPPATSPLDSDPAPKSGDSPENDRQVLIEFFDSTDGRSWKEKEGWATERDLKDWFGVRVSQTSGRVTKLLMSDNRLSGRIPVELGRLSELNHLNLSNNRLGWTIPSELGSLANLQYLNLSGNRFHGEIPPELGDLKELTYLYLDKNVLEGAIPHELSKLRELKKLKLANNEKLTGDLPAGLRDSVRDTV